MMVGSVEHVGWWCASVWHELRSARAHGHSLRPHKSAKISDLGKKHSLRVLLLGVGACPLGHGMDAQGGYNGDGWRHRLGALCHLGLEAYSGSAIGLKHLWEAKRKDTGDMGHGRHIGHVLWVTCLGWLWGAGCMADAKAQRAEVCRGVGSGAGRTESPNEKAPEPTPPPSLVPWGNMPPSATASAMQPAPHSHPKQTNPQHMPEEPTMPHVPCIFSFLTPPKDALSP